MEQLSPSQLTTMFLALGVLLAAARLLGEIAQRFHQPSVLGELLAGVLLGPTVLGTLAPAWHAALFPAVGPNALILDALSSLAVALFLLVAGMEVNLSIVWKQGRVAIKVGLAGMVIPFAAGFAAAWFAPEILGRTPDADAVIFALFFATALSISALPVIARTLMDLNLYRSDFGMIVISAAILNDLAGWIVFAIILGMIGAANGHESNIAMTIVLTLALAGSMLTVGRTLINRAMPWLQAYTHWPGGVLGFALALALLGSALAQWIGIHAIFGSFLVGIAVGDSAHLRERTRATIDQFISFIFAPLFFATIGLRVNFATNFDPGLVANVLLVACAGKILGCTLGGRWGGLPRRESWAVGVAMNARGAMEIILGLLALQAEIISTQLFVALVVMALVTSMMSGPLLQRLLRLRKLRGIGDFLPPRGFLRELQAGNPREAVQELAAALCTGTALSPDDVVDAVLAREQIQPTGIGNQVALPHARIKTLAAPMVAVGLSPAGLDFDAPDGRPAHLLIMILTPRDDREMQVEILAEIGRLFKKHRAVEQALLAKSHTEFRALLRSEFDGPADS